MSSYDTSSMARSGYGGTMPRTDVIVDTLGGHSDHGGHYSQEMTTTKTSAHHQDDYEEQEESFNFH